jgi:molecular chaperone GrpE (heat shock protein)
MEFKITNIEKGYGVANFDETKKYLIEGLKKYDNYIVDETNFLVAKSDRAELNKLAKGIENERKRVKKLILEVYDGMIEPQCKELVNLIDSVSTKIDEGIKAMESNEKAKKLETVKNIWNGYNFNLVSLEKVFDESWLNKGTSEKKIQEDITNIINHITSDLAVLDSLNPELKAKYLTTLNLAETVSNYNLEQEAKKRLGEKVDVTPITFKTEPIKSVDIRVKAPESKLARLGAFLRSEGYLVEQLTDVTENEV